MKKILFLLLLVFAPTLNAFEISETQLFNSRFWTNTAAVSFQPLYNFNVSGVFDITEHDDFNNHLYNFSLPMSLIMRIVNISITPFVLPDNANDASAYGARGTVAFNIIPPDGSSDVSAQIYFGVGYASQKALVARGAVTAKESNYQQLAYEMGIKYNFFDVYGMDLSANAFHYPSGVEGVTIRGALNNQDLGNLTTLDYVLGQPKASVGATMFWNSEESRSSSYLGYRYIDFHDKQYVHSLLAATSMLIQYNCYINLAYNHQFIVGDTDRDIFSGGISIKF